MGQDKALLQLQGEALLTRTCCMALTVSQRAIVITTRSDYQPLLPLGCELLLEAEPQGPLRAFAQGLEQGLEGAADAWVLLLACDLPLLTAEDLVRAIAHLPELPCEVDAYLPPAGSGGQASSGELNKTIDWEPLCGFYRQRCLQSLKGTLHRGNRSFQRWLPALNISPLTDWTAEHLLNCNRPQDWERALASLEQSGKGKAGDRLAPWFEA